MIHIVTGTAAFAGLKNAFHDVNDQILELPIDFSVGPIAHILSEEGMTNRTRWIMESFNLLNDYFDDQQSIYRNSFKSIQNINNGEQVTIWTCNNASEQIGMRIACSLLADKQVELYMVNTSQAMNDYSKNQAVQQTIRHSGECNAQQLAHFYKHSSQNIPVEMRTTFELEAEKLLVGTSHLRTWSQSIILDDSETRDDAFITDCIKSNCAQSLNHEYVDAIRIVGEVLGLSEQPLSDVWIDYRIRCLIQNGQVAYQGNFQSMRSYNVKVVD